MQKAFKKIVERLEKEKSDNLHMYMNYGLNTDLGRMYGTEKAIKIVNQVAEEYKADIEFAEKCVELAEKMNICDLVAENQRLSLKIMFLEAEMKSNDGWIPCSERLPSKEEYQKCNGQFIVSDGNRTYATYFDIYDTLKFGEPTIERFRVDKCVIAWQPLPQPYQPKGE